MSTFFEIPLSGTPETFSITLGGNDYRMTVSYLATDEGGWLLDIADANGNPLVNGIPLVTGIDLLAQYATLGIPGRLWVQTTNDPDAVPTFDNLGSESHLYFVTG